MLGSVKSSDCDVPLTCPLEELRLLRWSASPNHNERRPVGRMGLVSFTLVDHRQHGAAQCFGAAEFRVARGRTNSRGNELYGGGGIDGPVRDQQSARAGVDKGASEARESLGILGAA